MSLRPSSTRYISLRWVSQAGFSFLVTVIFSLLVLTRSELHAGENVERIVWDRTPISVTLKVGEERLIHFSTAVRAGLPPAFNRALRVQSINGTLYLLANETFDSTRILVREFESTRTYLLDINASEQGNSHPIHVHAEAIHRSNATSDHATDAAYVDTTPQHGYVALTRFAAQQVYAPKRLLKDLSGVHRVPLNGEQISLVRGGRVEALPLISWASNDLYVTAVQLKNTSTQAVILDPRELRGRWLTATFQHARLHARGSTADTTCVYLVSARPFHESM